MVAKAIAPPFQFIVSCRDLVVVFSLEKEFILGHGEILVEPSMSIQVCTAQYDAWNDIHSPETESPAFQTLREPLKISWVPSGLAKQFRDAVSFLSIYMPEYACTPLLELNMETTT